MVSVASLSPRERVERLRIEKRGEVGYDWLFPWFEEQEVLWAALQRSLRVHSTKSRRVGYTTLGTAFYFDRAYWRARGRRVLQVAHAPDSIDVLRTLVEDFHNTLPPELQAGITKGNDRATVFGNGCTFERRLSGAHGKVRGKGFHDLMFTEAAFYSSRKRRDSPSDEETFTSAMATLDADDASVLVESTGNGPHGLHYRLYRDPDWDHVFVPWTMCKRYQTTAPAGFDRELDGEELKLYDGGDGLSLDQIAWRRKMIATHGRLQFRREYPLTDAEPYFAEKSRWFDHDPLNEALQRLAPLSGPTVRLADRPVLEVFIKPEPGRRYWQGVDPSKGTGRDAAAGQVVRDDLVQCARWRSNTISEHAQGKMAADVSNHYNRALTLIEGNRGKTVIEIAGSLGCPLWKDAKNHDWWSRRGMTGTSKGALYSHARELVHQDLPTFWDAETVRELLGIVEKETGEIEADGDGPDDLADAWVMAVFAGKGYHSRPGTYNASREQLKAQQRMRDAPNWERSQ